VITWHLKPGTLKTILKKAGLKLKNRPRPPAGAYRPQTSLQNEVQKPPIGSLSERTASAVNRGLR
jgi:hypothetical protein